MSDPTVIWDFRDVRTAPDLGSRVAEFAELSGPARLVVIAPSGRRIEGSWARGAIAEAGGTVSLGGPAKPISRVVLLDESASSPAELRAAVDRYQREWGPARRGGQTLDAYVDAFEALVDEAGGVIDPRRHGTDGEGGGSTVRTFEGVAQDGVAPSLGLHVLPGAVTVRITLDFEPSG